MNLVSDCVICGHEKCRLVNASQTKPSNCFICGKKVHCFKKFVLTKFEMISLNVNKLLLTGDEFVSKLYLKQRRLTLPNIVKGFKDLNKQLI